MLAEYLPMVLRDAVWGELRSFQRPYRVQTEVMLHTTTLHLLIRSPSFPTSVSRRLGKDLRTPSTSGRPDQSKHAATPCCYRCITSTIRITLTFRTLLNVAAIGREQMSSWTRTCLNQAGPGPSLTFAPGRLLPCSVKF